MPATNMFRKTSDLSLTSIVFAGVYLPRRQGDGGRRQGEIAKAVVAGRGGGGSRAAAPDRESRGVVVFGRCCCCAAAAVAQPGDDFGGVGGAGVGAVLIVAEAGVHHVLGGVVVADRPDVGLQKAGDGRRRGGGGSLFGERRRRNIPCSPCLR